MRALGGSPPTISKSSQKLDGKPGLDIHILSGAKGETVSIPACVTHGDVDDLVYNDFYVGRRSGSHYCGRMRRTHREWRACPAQRNPPVFPFKNAKVKYVEKHVGTGSGQGSAPSIRSLRPSWTRGLYWKWIPPRSAGWTALTGVPGQNLPQGPSC